MGTKDQQLYSGVADDRKRSDHEEVVLLLDSPDHSSMGLEKDNQESQLTSGDTLELSSTNISVDHGLETQCRDSVKLLGSSDVENAQNISLNLDDDRNKVPPLLQDSFETTETILLSAAKIEGDSQITMEFSQEARFFEQKFDAGTGVNEVSEIHLSGTKRRRLSDSTQQPTVHMVYSHITRLGAWNLYFSASESKRKLEELMQQWAEWHAKNVASDMELLKGALISGSETYFPALHIGRDKTNTVTYWLDKKAGGNVSNDVSAVDTESAPFYDREYACGLASGDGSTSQDRDNEAREHDSRCFNCGSYSHSLKECPKRIDNAAVSNARMLHNSKKKTTGGPRLPTRYYQDTPGGKFDGLKPGIVGPETRQYLGIGEDDPPPWLNRMREIGYPPGYLEGDDHPSGITIYTDKECEAVGEDGEILEADNSNSVDGKKMTVDFPGVNAPLPENADSRVWAASPRHSFDSDGSRSRPYSRYQSDNRSFSNHVEETPPGGSARVAHHRQGYTNYDNYSEPPTSRGYFPVLRSPSSGGAASVDGGRWNPYAGDGSYGQNHSSYRDPGHIPYGPPSYSSPSYLSPRSSHRAPNGQSPSSADPWSLTDWHRMKESRDPYSSANSSHSKDYRERRDSYWR